MKKNLILLVILLNLIFGIQSFSELSEKEYEKILEPIDKEYEKGNKEKAISMLKEKINENTEDVYLQIILGMYYDENNNIKEADEEFAKAIENAKKNPLKNEKGEKIDVKIVIGTVYSGFEKYEKALKWYKEYEKENPNDAIVQYLIGNINLNYGDVEEAKKYYLKSEKEDEDGIVDVALGYIYDEIEGNQKEGIKWYLKGAEKGNLIAHSNLSLLYLGLEDYRKAESWIKKGIELAKKKGDKEEIKKMEEILKSIQNELN